jgi:hypothetical protein
LVAKPKSQSGEGTRTCGAEITRLGKVRRGSYYICRSRIAASMLETESAFDLGATFPADPAMLTLLRGDPLCAEGQSSISVDQSQTTIVFDTKRDD